MGQKRQGGSTIGYVLIGIVLIASLVGGVYALRQATAQKPAEVVKQPSEDKEEQQQTKKQEQPKEQQSQTSDDNDKVADAPTPGESAQSEQAKESTSGAMPATGATELPRTGGNSAEGWLVLGLLSGVGVAYMRSRRFTLT